MARKRKSQESDPGAQRAAAAAKSRARKTLAVTEDTIRQRAYEIYLARDCRDGCAERDWLEAQSELTQASR